MFDAIRFNVFARRTSSVRSTFVLRRGCCFAAEFGCGAGPWHEGFNRWNLNSDRKSSGDKEDV